MNLYIFRHGATYFSKNHIPYGDQIETAEILPEGIPAIKRLAEHLKIIPSDKNLTSPFVRCVKTSGIVSETSGKQFEIDKELRDWDPRSETTREMISRILRFTDRLRSGKYKSVCICTHGYPINALIAYFTKGEIKESDLPKFPNTGVLSIIKSGKVKYKDFN